ncbi:MAG: primosomal protein N' [Rickettsiales bacterium]
MKKVAVIVPRPFDQNFTYLAPENFSPGNLVKVPFGGNTLFGVIDSEITAEDNPKLKPIQTVYPYSLNTKHLDFLQWVANYYMAPIGMLFKMSIGGILAIDNPEKYIMPRQSYTTSLATLNEQQQTIFQSIAKTLDSFSTNLIQGVTGSGKTEVYLHLVDKVIKDGGQVLILLPEIFLSTQLIERFEKRMGFRPTEWHSSVSIKGRKQNWISTLVGESQLIVGARSALFLPFKNLKLIIVDEEHDASFKQDEGICYNARDMAIVKARIENIPVVLASATPSVESYQNALEGKYKLFSLENRFGGSILPELVVVNTTDEKLPRGQFISKKLIEQMAATYARGKQSMLFLNRRGYAPVTMCGDCSEIIACPDCSFNMVSHKSSNTLQCHYCGHVLPQVLKCPACSSTEKIFPVGVGVEKIEEEVRQALPDAKVLLLTSDTVPNTKLLSKLLIEIVEKKYDIIIGTQMVAKGLHFPFLHLVGIIDADGLGAASDIRAIERTYQLLHQVSGRAGREKDKGLVIVQCRNPVNLDLDNLINDNIDAFLRSEIEDRKAAGMPPFRRLIVITIASPDQKLNLSVVNTLQRTMPEVAGVEILGAAPAPIFKLRKNFRHRFVVIAGKQVNIQKLLKQWLAVKHPARVRISVDLDPLSLS